MVGAQRVEWASASPVTSVKGFEFLQRRGSAGSTKDPSLILFRSRGEEGFWLWLA